MRARNEKHFTSVEELYTPYRYVDGKDPIKSSNIPLITVSGRPTPGIGFRRAKETIQLANTKTIQEQKYMKKKIGSSVQTMNIPASVPTSEFDVLKSNGLELIELLAEGSYSKVYLCKVDKELNTRSELINSHVEQDEYVEVDGGRSEDVAANESDVIDKEDQAGAQTLDDYSEGKASNISEGFVLALKMIDTDRASRIYMKKFLPRELSVLLKIHHPHIIKLYRLVQRKVKFFMCFRYAERGDLLEFILSHGLITENRARYWAYQIGTAIEYLHTMNVVHRDIKAENILITAGYNVKLCDFGFARFVGHEELSSTFCGTIPYASPEILQFKSYDAKKADMWSFGVVIFVMLVKKFPYRETENPKLLLTEQLEKVYEIPANLEEILSMQAKKALKHLLKTMPRKRWSIEEFLNSEWLGMDIRSIFHHLKERDALNEAVEIAANRAGKLWIEMEEYQQHMVGQALTRIKINCPETFNIWRSTYRPDYLELKRTQNFRTTSGRQSLEYERKYEQLVKSAEQTFVLRKQQLSALKKLSDSSRYVESSSRLKKWIIKKFIKEKSSLIKLNERTIDNGVSVGPSTAGEIKGQTSLTTATSRRQKKFYNKWRWWQKWINRQVESSSSFVIRQRQ